MPSARALLRRLVDRTRGTAFDRAIDRLAREPRDGVLLGWNRGLGDVALGLSPLFERLRREAPAARITVLTRPDLHDAFSLTSADRVLAVPSWKRGAAIDFEAACRDRGVDPTRFAAVFPEPDPTRWLEGRRHRDLPRLAWRADWDRLADPLLPAAPGVTTIAAHVSSETAGHYGYSKDWPAGAWRELLAAFPAGSGVRWVLLGLAAEAAFAGDNVVDLRGRTPLPALLAVVRGSRVLVAPDSGVLSLAYYLADPHPLDVVSVWADPGQGVLKQGTASPNPRLAHRPLLAPGGDLARLPVATVASAVRESLASMR